MGFTGLYLSIMTGYEAKILDSWNSNRMNKTISVLQAPSFQRKEQEARFNDVTSESTEMPLENIELKKQRTEKCSMPPKSSPHINKMVRICILIYVNILILSVYFRN